MRIKIFFYLTTIALSITTPVQAEVNLADLIAEAVENNPRIQAAYNEWQAARYEVKVTSGLDDPILSYTYFGNNVETRVGPQEHKYGVSQKIPFPGKLSLKGKSKAREADILQQSYKAVKREIIREVKFTYCDIFWVDKAIQITEAEKAILESLEKVAQRRYESNLTPQQDVIKAQLELSQLIDKLFQLEENRNSLVAKMNTILGRDQNKELGKAAGVKEQEFRYELEDLHDIALRESQGLNAAKLGIEKAKFDKSRAKMEYLPDFTFGFDYIEVGDGETTQGDDGDDAWMASVKVNLPLWLNKKNSQVKQKESSLKVSEKMYQDTENILFNNVEDLYFKVTTYRDIISLYKTALVPQAEQAFEAARTGYESGKIDFLNWLDAERILLRMRLAYYKSIVDYNKAIADLEEIVGREL